MPSRIWVVTAVFLAASPAFAAPRYLARSRSLRIVLRSDPNQVPAPAPAPATASEPKLARIVAVPFRTAPAAPPTILPLPKSIDAEALAQFAPSFQSGGGFMPLTLGGRVQPRQDVVIEP